MSEASDVAEAAADANVLAHRFSNLCDMLGKGLIASAEENQCTQLVETGNKLRMAPVFLGMLAPEQRMASLFAACRWAHQLHAELAAPVEDQPPLDPVKLQMGALPLYGEISTEVLQRGVKTICDFLKQLDLVKVGLYLEYLSREDYRVAQSVELPNEIVSMVQKGLVEMEEKRVAREEESQAEIAKFMQKHRELCPDCQCKHCVTPASSSSSIAADDSQ